MEKHFAASVLGPLMFFINDLNDALGNIVTELEDGSKLGEGQVKTLLMVWKGKKIQLS